MLCKHCHKPIQKLDARWYHLHSNFIRCDGLPLGSFSPDTIMPVAIPKATS